MNKKDYDKLMADFDLQSRLERNHLRDQFAMAALQGLLAADIGVIDKKDDINGAADIAFMLADAMLKAREE